MEDDEINKESLLSYNNSHSIVNPSLGEDLSIKILAFCLKIELQDVDKAINNAKILLQKYKGQEEDLIMTLNKKYGKITEESIEKARILLDSRGKLSSPSQIQRSKSPSITVKNMKNIFSTKEIRDPIISRMRRKRELDDLLWRQIHSTIKSLIPSLKEVQQRIALQEVEIARLRSEIIQRTKAIEREDQARNVIKEELASKITRLQLRLMRLRSSLHSVEQEGTDIEKLSDIEYQKHLLNAQKREESDLIKVYRRALIKHFSAYPLSPFRQEIHHIDLELWEMMNEPQLL